MCQSHVDARFPMERSASTKIRNPSVTLHKQACKMLSQWSVIWVGKTFPQGDAGLLRLLAVHNDLGPAPSSSFAGGGAPFGAAHRIEFAIALTMAEAQVKNRFTANLCKSGEPRLDSHSSEDTLQHMQI